MSSTTLHFRVSNYGPPTGYKSQFGNCGIPDRVIEVQETKDAEPITPSAETSQVESSAQALEEAPATSGQVKEPEANLQDETTSQETTSEAATTECQCLMCTYGPAEPVSEPVSEPVLEHVPAAMPSAEQIESCKCLGCTYGPAEPVEETTTEHVHAAMSPTTSPQGCKPDDNVPSKDPVAETEEEPSVVASTKDQTGELNSADPTRDFTADLYRQVASVKEKAQSKHHGRPPDDGTAKPGPEPQDRPPDRFKEGARIEDQMPSYAWHLEEEGRCWEACVAHSPLLPGINNALPRLVM